MFKLSRLREVTPGGLDLPCHEEEPILVEYKVHIKTERKDKDHEVVVLGSSKCLINSGVVPKTS